MPRKGEPAPWLRGGSRPPSGIPASGIPAGGDMGWGGPKGAGSGKAHRGIGKDGHARKLAIPKEVRKAKSEKRKITREMIIGVYETVALNKKAPHMARVMAADKWLDRIEGKAPQAQVNYEGGAKTLEQLVAESMKPKE